MDFLGDLRNEEVIQKMEAFGFGSRTLHGVRPHSEVEDSERHIDEGVEAAHQNHKTGPAHVHHGQPRMERLPGSSNTAHVVSAIAPDVASEPALYLSGQPGISDWLLLHPVSLAARPA